MSFFSENISLLSYNTFGIDVKAKYFAVANSVQQLNAFLKTDLAKSENIFVLGGGSNVLLSKNVDALVILNRIKGIEIINENDEYVYVKSGSGEVWHELVLWCVGRNYGGIENMSLIPGCVGAGPIQNIGAYGAELKNVFHELEGVFIDTGELTKFSLAGCKFGYRESVFKHELKGKFIITSVTLRLNKKIHLNTTYGAIEHELKNNNITAPTIRDISNAVIKIRKSKLPDPSVLGNAGSFFKNPEVTKEKFDILKTCHEKIVAFDVPNGNIKLSAGWLIEQCGWKGKKIGNTGAHKDQALVLVNYGNATGNEVYSLALEIKKSVREKFDVDIETEVNII